MLLWRGGVNIDTIRLGLGSYQSSCVVMLFGVQRLAFAGLAAFHVNHTPQFARMGLLCDRLGNILHF